MENLHENTKLRPLLPCSSLPLFAPTSFHVSDKSYNHVNRFEATIPFSSSSDSRDSSSSLQHDEKKKKNVVINGVRVEVESAGGCNKLHPNMDPRKLRRIISNRVSAQKSRMKKLQYVSDMENKAKALEAKIAILHPQVVMYKNKQHLLEMEQKSLTQEISTRANKKLLNNEEIEENKAELNRLRKLYLVQEGAWNKDGFEQIINIQFQSMDLMMNSNQGNIGGEMSQSWRDNAITEEIDVISSTVGGIEQILHRN